MICRGVTRTVVLVGPVAVKVPSLHYLVRGWLANRSEWRQRRRPDVARPWLSLVHLALVMPRAERCWPEEYRWKSTGEDGDEGKGSSWGLFGDRWLLIDYDRAWALPRGWVGALYFANQERLGRKWSRLPFG